MSNGTTPVIQRQWQIILLLIKVRYVSTKDIQKHLKKQNIHSEIRTIQRDLVVLEEIFPLECRKEDKPYSWRWKQLATDKTEGLSVTQALALRLIETELQAVIPSELLADLEPLLMKARIQLALLQFGNTALLLDDNLKDSASSKTISTGDGANTLNFSPHPYSSLLKNNPLLTVVKKRLTLPKLISSINLLSTKKSSQMQQALNLNDKQKQAIKQLSALLEKLQLSTLQQHIDDLLISA